MWYEHHHSKNKLLLQRFCGHWKYAKATIDSGLVNYCLSYFDGCSHVMLLGSSRLENLKFYIYFQMDLDHIIKENLWTWALNHDVHLHCIMTKQLMCRTVNNVTYFSGIGVQVCKRFFTALMFGHAKAGCPGILFFLLFPTFSMFSNFPTLSTINQSINLISY